MLSHYPSSLGFLVLLYVPLKLVHAGLRDGMFQPKQLRSCHVLNKNAKNFPIEKLIFILLDFHLFTIYF
jgi:hypothetical protein